MTTTKAGDLSNELKKLYPVATVEIEDLPSGVFYLTIRLGDRVFVLMHSPRDSGFGVDELFSDEGFDTGYHHWCTSDDEALSRLRQIMESPPRREEQTR